MKLCITEKPSVAKSIAAVIGAYEKKDGYYIGNGYIVTWALGHLVTFKEPEEYGFSKQEFVWGSKEEREKVLSELPLVPDFEMKPIEKTVKQFNVVKKLINSSDVELIIDCGDMGAEGHVLQWMIRKVANCTKPVKRFCAVSMTESALKKGFENLKNESDFSRIIKGEFAKKKADWILGMSMSRLLSVKYSARIDVGRVQSPTLYFVVKRYAEVINFKPKDFYKIKIKSNDLECLSKKIDDKAEAENIYKKISQEKKIKVNTVTHKRKMQKAPRLFDLTELQRQANRRFDFTADRTLKVAQNLYEKHKITTYPRTDSRYITEDLVPEIKKMVEVISDISYFKKQAKKVLDMGLNLDKRIVDDSKVSDHHALILTNKKIKDEDIDNLNDDEKKILFLIIKRILDSLCQGFFYDETNVELECSSNNLKFSAKGNTIVSLGWKEFQDKKENEIILPSFKEGDEIEITEKELLKKKTQPPKLHTEDTLLSAMENAGTIIEGGEAIKEKGIGTTATRAAIIKSLFDKNYIKGEKKGKITYLIPTQNGISTIKVIPQKLYSPKMTAEWEESIKRIQDGEMTAEFFLDKFKEFITNTINESSKNKIEVEFVRNNGEIVGKCPECSEDVIEGVGKGKGLYFCSNKKCNFTLDKNNKFFVARTRKSLSKSQIKKLLKDGQIKTKCISKADKEYQGLFKLTKSNEYYVLEFDFVKKIAKKRIK